MLLFVLMYFLTALVAGQEIEKLDDRYGNLNHLKDDPHYFCGIIDPYDVYYSILWRVKPTEDIEINSRWINYIKPFVFWQCRSYQKCETLRITNTKIYTINKSMLDGLENVTNISFFNNTLDTIKNGTFDQLIKLRELELSYNRLTGLDFDVRKGLKKLAKLHLNGNPIILEKNGFTGLPKLELLELTGANITTIPPRAFHGLKNLERLDLSNNNLTSIMGSKFENLNHLEQLDLSLNSISFIGRKAFKGLTSLKDLWLNDNKIGTLMSHDIFDDIDNLEYLYLHSNPLFILDLAVFRNMPKVIIEPGFNITTPKVVQKNFSNTTSISLVCHEAVDYYVPYNCLVNYRVNAVLRT